MIKPARERGQRWLQHPARVVPIAFACLVAVGTVLLMLPISRQGPGSAPFLTALFTATFPRHPLAHLVDNRLHHMTALNPLPHSKTPRATTPSKPRQANNGASRIDSRQNNHTLNKPNSP